MNGKINTPRTVCKAIVAVAIAAIAIAAIIGCSSLGGGSRKQNIATVIQTAYDLGGREAVSNRIEKLVADGTLSQKQGAKIHELMQKAYEGLVDNLSRRIEEAAVDESGEGEDANCGRCEDCKAK